MWKILRVGFLLYVLVMVAVGSWLTRARTTDWNDTLWVSIHPINADGSAVSRDYIQALESRTFEPIAEFFSEEAEYHELGLSNPVRVALGTEIDSQPPLPPVERNALTVALWSLRLRFWAMMADKGDGPPAHIDIYVRYHDPARSSRLAHSLGLQKGMLGVVNAFAADAQTGSNNVIIAHEMLHTVGASDKYDPRTNGPLYPDGYADPEAEPLYPQTAAEIMGGRIAVTEHEFRIPRSLKSVVIGDATAAEIRWYEP